MKLLNEVQSAYCIMPVPLLLFEAMRSNPLLQGSFSRLRISIHSLQSENLIPVSKIKFELYNQL
jgi:hypothetical protein